ncbi:MAG: hypothetical protein GY899_12505 [Verrucomicrobiaceae bacterium]|nr:hypothetical protein [Verrucomicrobiaceae bacterium]
MAIMANQTRQGRVVIPSLKINEKFELVSRYQFTTSNGGGGLRLQKRYERLATSINDSPDRGDSYHAGYFGLNHFLDGNDLKLMVGIEVSSMGQGKDEYNAWTIMTGVRMAF